MKKILFLLTGLLFMLAGCSDGGSESPEKPNPTPTPTPEETASITIDSGIITNGVAFDAKGGEKSVNFSANKDWTLSVATPANGTVWCTPSATSGAKGDATVKFTIKENADYEDRSVSVTIKAGTASKTFTITQKSAEALLVTSTKFEVPQEGGAVEVEVKANINYELQIAENAKSWISETKSRALTTKKYAFTIAASEEYEKREGEIHIKSGDKLETVKVYQAGGAIIMLSKSDYSVSSEGETISVDIKSNMEYGVQMPNVDWITEAPASRATSSHTLKYVIAPNETHDARSAEIIFYDKNGSLKDTLKVTQAQKDAIIISKKEYDVKSDGETIEVKLSANVDFKVTMPEVDWISQVTARALTEHTLYFKVAENKNYDGRSAEIVITNKISQLSEKITVSQQKATLLQLTKDEYNVSDAGETISVELKSNIEYGIQMPEVDWITASPSTRSVSADTLKFVVLPNENYDSRSVKIIFYDKNSNLKDTLKIVQVQKDAILVAKNEYEFESAGGNLDFSINTNVDFEVSISVDWIKRDVGSRGLIEKALNFIVEDNKSKEPREGEIVFACRELKQTVKVIQKGTVDYEAIERAALAEFYSVAGGESWINKTNWCSDKALNEWYGISTDENGRVIEIRLASNGEKGDISKIVHAITPLTELKVLYLCPNNTDIYGSFPSEIYNFSNLEILLIDSQLEGEMTIDINKLNRLKILSVRGIKISALVFKELCCSLTELENLYFHNCKVEGTIPEEIANLKKLNVLNLLSSNIGGLLPESIWDLPLTSLSFQGNPDLSGTISSKIKNLKELGMLNLSGCAFSGSIPVEICECINLEDLWLSDNKLEGSIPDNIGNLKKLHILELQNNNLTGNIPASMSQLSNLVVCSLFGNRLSGKVPKEVSDMWSIWVPFNKIIPQQDGYQLIYDDIYASTDYSKDGEIIQLQEHTEGNGIPVILLGDAFVDTDMETGGLYETTMKRAMETYFSIEPMISLRPLFDVYLVKCVSENNFIGGKTALSSKHSAEGEGTGGDADMSKCLEYASKVIDDLADVQIKVIMNDKQQIGYCVYLDDNCTISFNSLYDQGLDWQNFEAVFRHEAIGHGFGLLADEYADHIRTITEEEKENLRYSQQVMGRNLNVDVVNNPEQVLWSKFLSDNRYTNENLGVYEGGLAHYSHGVYRPSYNSIMRYNEPIFNAPSREAIYKRAMKLAYGEGWKYDYEEFVKFDEKSHDAISRSAIKPLTEAEQKEYIKNHRPPTFIKGTWRDIMKNKR